MALLGVYFGYGAPLARRNPPCKCGYRNEIYTSTSRASFSFIEACKQRFKAKYVRLPALLLDLEIARTENNYRKVLMKYANPRLLFLDEWLLLKPTETEQHDILELLHARRKKSSTIFYSQYHDNGWYNQIDGDNSPLAEALLDRIKHDAYKIHIIPADPANYRSMREVYGLDKSLSE
ncbi:ATP-binding protein [uncultured Dysosmobacter sp.]|uniref:ATP-binding protein n=1 Tax=uncultured Dysosmobacter sp. TaxID=2591384 RepID=UPI0034412784